MHARGHRKNSWNQSLTLPGNWWISTTWRVISQYSHDLTPFDTDDEEPDKVLGVIARGRVLIGVWTPREGKVAPLLCMPRAVFTGICIGSWFLARTQSDKSESRSAYCRHSGRKPKKRNGGSKNRAELDKNFVKAAQEGKLKRLDQTAPKARLANSITRVVSIRLPENDIELARRQATEKGLT
jgi:hypothetical protein